MYLPEGDGVPLTAINQALSKYNGHYTPAASFKNPLVEFGSEQDLLVFKLTYSN